MSTLYDLIITILAVFASRLHKIKKYCFETK
jgi:hypothetical protein